MTNVHYCYVAIHGAYSCLRREVHSATAERLLLSFGNNPSFHYLHAENINFRKYLLLFVYSAHGNLDVFPSTYNMRTTAYINNSYELTRLCSMISKTVKFRENLLDRNCMFHFSLQILLETFFAPINI
jgi:hypothetical protein